jgi:hypothetical protein
MTDTTRLERHDLDQATETLTHLVWDLDSATAVEAELCTKSPRELRAMIVEKLRRDRFDLHTRHSAPTYDVGGIEAYERWAGHLGLGPVVDESLPEEQQQLDHEHAEKAPEDRAHRQE